MFTVVISVTFSRRLLRQESIYTLKLSRRGIHLHGGRDVLQSVTVGEIMQPQPVTVAQDMPLTELSEAFSRYRRRGFPVLTADADLRASPLSKTWTGPSRRICPAKARSQPSALLATDKR